MIGFIDDQRAAYGVESICRGLPIAPPTYYHCLVYLVEPSKASVGIKVTRVIPHFLWGLISISNLGTGPTLGTRFL